MFFLSIKTTKKTLFCGTEVASDSCPYLDFAEWIWTLHIWQTQAYKLVEIYIFSPFFIVVENREILDTV